MDFTIINWETIASLFTALATILLALATFLSVRSASKSARVSERALLASSLPILTPSYIDDVAQKIRYADDYWIKVEGGRAYIELRGDVVYLAISIRNVGPGLAALDRWRVYTGDIAQELEPGWSIAAFRRLTRDIYVAGSGTVGYWQGAIRDPHDPQFDYIRQVISNKTPLVIDVLYTNHEGGQRSISRFILTPRDNAWFASVGRIWQLDTSNPRSRV